MSEAAAPQPQLVPQQAILLELPEQEAKPARPKGAPRLREPERRQFVIDQFDLDQLIPANHTARAIWELTGMLPTEGFLADNKSVEGHPGRPRLSPQMMLALWVYGYSRGLGEANAIAEEMKYEPGLRWLAGNQLVCGRSLSEFRVAHGDALKQVFVEMLAVLSREELVDLTELTLDGTKIKANAAGASRRREKTLQKHLEEASAAVQELGRREVSAELSQQRWEAQRRGAEQRRQRLEEAAEELKQIREGKRAKEKEAARVSETDPEARVMKNGEGAYVLGYNVQLAVETQNKIIVDIAVTQPAGDQQQLQPALERLEGAPGLPQTIIVDGGYVTHDNIVLAQQCEVDMIAPVIDIDQRQQLGREASLRSAGIAVEFGPQAFVQIEDGAALQCPAGKRLKLIGNSEGYQRYRSSASDCAACPHRSQCAPQGERSVKIKADPTTRQQTERDFSARMGEEANREKYKKRGPVAEFPHAWIKEKFQLRQFHVRGLVKAGLEAMWAALAYNVCQWERLVWRKQFGATAAV